MSPYTCAVIRNRGSMGMTCCLLFVWITYIRRIIILMLIRICSIWIWLSLRLLWLLWYRLIGDMSRGRMLLLLLLLVLCRRLLVGRLLGFDWRIVVVIILILCNLRHFFSHKFLSLILASFRNFSIESISIFSYWKFLIIIHRNFYHMVAINLLFNNMEILHIRMFQGLLNSQSMIWVENE